MVLALFRKQKPERKKSKQEAKPNQSIFQRVDVLVESRHVRGNADTGTEALLTDVAKRFKKDEDYLSDAKGVM
jgi:hypothetical protein